MRALPFLIALGLGCGVPMGFAQSEDQDHSAHHDAQSSDADTAPHSGHDHGSAKASPLQENMKKAEALMQQIQRATDQAEKRELLSRHLQVLQEQMRLIRSQGPATKMSMEEGGKTDAGMMGPMMKGGGMMAHKKVEQRLDMLERLMQQVIEREAAEADGQ
jgi:hypothetical protein